MVDTRKTTQPTDNRLWVFPHGVSFRHSPAHVATIDEMQLEYEPGVSVALVRKHFAKTYADIHTGPEADWDAVHDGALEEAEKLVGFWVAPHHVWSAIGALFDTKVEDEGQDEALHEAALRYVAHESVLHIGQTPED